MTSCSTAAAPIPHLLLSLCLALCSLQVSTGVQPASAEAAPRQVSQESAQVGEAVWEFHGDREGIRILTRDSSIEGLKTVRAETMIPVDDPFVIVAILSDSEASVEMMDTVSEVQELEGGEAGVSRMLMVLDMPWPLSDRDVAAEVSIRHDLAKHQFLLTLVGRPEMVPPNPDRIRVPRFHSSYLIHYGEREGDGVHVTFESTVDPGGKIPAWVMNYGITGMPVKTLRNLRRLADQERYHGQRERLEAELQSI